MALKWALFKALKRESEDVFLVVTVNKNNSLKESVQILSNLSVKMCQLGVKASLRLKQSVKKGEKKINTAEIKPQNKQDSLD